MASVVNGQWEKSNCVPKLSDFGVSRLKGECIECSAQGRRGNLPLHFLSSQLRLHIIYQSINLETYKRHLLSYLLYRHRTQLNSTQLHTTPPFPIPPPSSPSSPHPPNASTTPSSVNLARSASPRHASCAPSRHEVSSFGRTSSIRWRCWGVGEEREERRERMQGRFFLEAARWKEERGRGWR